MTDPNRKYHVSSDYLANMTIKQKMARIGMIALVSSASISFLAGCADAENNGNSSSATLPNTGSNTLVVPTPTPTIPGWAIECTASGEPKAGITGHEVKKIIKLPFPVPSGDKIEVEENRNGGANFFSDRNATSYKGNIAPCEETDVICEKEDPSSEVASAHGHWYLIRKKIGNTLVNGWIAANTFWNKLDPVRPDTNVTHDPDVRACTDVESNIITLHIPSPNAITQPIEASVDISRLVA
jgi:hypothetical protein